MSEQKWTDIEYNKLPSKAGMKYRKAFKKHDEERYGDFLSSLSKGETTVNSSTLMPYEIINKIVKFQRYGWSSDTAIGFVNDEFTSLYNAMWKNLPNYLEGYEGDTLVVMDTSASMTWYNDALAMYTCLALGLYFSERNNGPMKNVVAAFNAQPSILELKGDTLCEKIEYIFANLPIGGNTNIEALFDLILNSAKDADLPADQLPNRIIIVSDMEFDKASTAPGSERLFQTITNKWRGTGYRVPHLVFWNVNAKNENSPMTMSDAGVQFVSGNSPTTFKALIKGELLDAYSMMLSTLNADRYKDVTL
jgi:hypothetical protein